MADAGYITVFDQEHVKIYDANNTQITATRAAVINGWRDSSTGMWRVALLPTVSNVNTDTALLNRPPTEFLPDRPLPTEAIHNVYELKTQPELIRYLHAAAGHPTKDYWIKAIKNKQYASWPGLTTDAVRKYFPESEETHKGHGRKTRSGLRSTKKATQQELEEDDFTGPRPTLKSGEVHVRITKVLEEATGKLSTDQTGRFPKKSQRGYEYIMTLYEYDSNAILVEPMKNRTSGEMLRAYIKLIGRLVQAGITPKHHILDNECSAEFKAQIKLFKMTYQLVPPHDHRRNAAEKAIQIFKDHFVAILCGTDTSFPLYLWCRILPQAEHTLNMLRPARMTPTISAYAYLWGQHDYNVNPLAPLGTKVQAHVTPSKRETWAAHTATGYYIGNAWESYRCHSIYISDTRSIRICETVFFKHKYITMPSFTPADALI